MDEIIGEIDFIIANWILFLAFFRNVNSCYQQEKNFCTFAKN